MSIPQRLPFRAHDLHPGDVDVLIEYFAKYCHVRGDNECWLWTGVLNSRGYGVVRAQARDGLKGHMAHRVAWVLASHQSLTDDLTIDHLCRNTRCVNPAHLEPVPIEENMRRMMAARPSSPQPEPIRRTWVNYEVDPSHPGRRICPKCRIAYDRTYVSAHIRRVHPEAA